VDIEKYKFGESSLPVNTKPEPSRGRKIKGKFILGPIPLELLKSAASLQGKALQIVLCIFFLVGIQKASRVKLSYKLLSEFGVSRSSAYRGIEALENAGLISVERHPGRSPRVTLKDF
jgi:hypothetical protein